MTDLKTEAAQAAQSVQATVASAETAAVATAKAFEAKQVGWVRSRWLVLAIGAGAGAAVTAVLAALWHLL